MKYTPSIGTYDEREVRWCYDVAFKRRFRSSEERIRKVQNDINERIVCGYSVTLNEFYRALGLSEIKEGDSLGWDADHMLNIKFTTDLYWDADHMINIKFTSDLASGGKSMLILEYEAYPDCRDR